MERGEMGEIVSESRGTGLRRFGAIGREIMVGSFADQKPAG